MVSVMLYHCMFCVALLMDLFVVCVGCVFYFVVECYGLVVKCGWRCSVGYTMYGLPKNVCGVPVIPVIVQILLPYVLFVFLYVGSYLLIQKFESWTTAVFSPYVVSLCDFA